MAKIPKSFTSRHQGLANSLKTECGVSEAYVPSPGTVHPKVERFIGLWDTGATGSVISQNVIDKLGLKPTGKATSYHAGGSSIVDTYLVNILLPNSTGFHSVRVTHLVLKDFDILIGMDIITKGDFSITNVGNKTTFSFRMPSTKEIDYTAESVEAQKITDVYSPCPCGSGKKYKFCCGATT